MKVVDRGIVFDATTAPSSRRFCSFTSARVLSDGRILVAFRAGSSKDSADENIIVRLSADGGKTWKTVFEGLDLILDGVPGAWRSGALTEVEPNRLIGQFCWFDHSDPTLPLANPETQGTLPSHIVVRESLDDGRTWIDPREVDPKSFTGIAATGAILKLANGDLAVPYEAWKDYYDTSPGEHHAILRISHDGARTFEPSVIVAHDPSANLFFWDQRLAVDPETGRMIALFWTHDRAAGHDVNVHVGWGSPDGKAWTYPLDAGFGGQIASPLVLPGGRVLAVYVHRHAPPSLRAVMSPDFGKTWNVDNELVFYKSGAGKESGMGGKRDFGDYWADMNVWSFGHPEADLLPNGDVLVAHYGGDANAMSIHWERIAV